MSVYTAYRKPGARCWARIPERFAPDALRLLFVTPGTMASDTEIHRSREDSYNLHKAVLLLPES